MWIARSSKKLLGCNDFPLGKINGNATSDGNMQRALWPQKGTTTALWCAPRSSPIRGFGGKVSHSVIARPRSPRRTVGALSIQCERPKSPSMLGHCNRRWCGGACTICIVLPFWRISRGAPARGSNGPLGRRAANNAVFEVNRHCLKNVLAKFLPSLRFREDGAAERNGLQHPQC